MRGFFQFIAAVVLASTQLVSCGGGSGCAIGALGCAASTGNPTEGTAIQINPNGDPSESTLTIIEQPQNRTVYMGDRASFSVKVSGTNPYFNWMRNGIALPGENLSTYTVPAASASDHGSVYSVRVSNGKSSVTSNDATLKLQLSPDQAAFEAVILAKNGGSSSYVWNLSSSNPQLRGVNFLAHSSTSLPESPLTKGPIRNQVQWYFPMGNTLDLLSFPPSRVLIGGKILLVTSNPLRTTVQYIDRSVQVDSLVEDGVSIGASQFRSEFTFVPLNGTLADTPVEMKKWFNTLFSNPALLNSATAFLPDAGYLRFKMVSNGDRYNVEDCGLTTTGSNPSACAVSGPLASALTVGISRDVKLYKLSDGVLSNVDGVPIWIANVARTRSPSVTTPQFRFFFELNNQIYTGSLIKDKTTLIGSTYLQVGNDASTTIEYLPYGIRLNNAAHMSLRSALTF